jgi:hypothetical protein
MATPSSGHGNPQSGGDSCLDRYQAVHGHERVPAGGRFIRFATDEKATTTLAMPAECFEILGGVPKVVLDEARVRTRGGIAVGTVPPWHGRG